MLNIETVGSTAAFLTTVSFVPQAARVIRTGDTAAISLAMYLMFTSGVALWGVYGLLIESRPIIVANAVTASLASIILTQKIRHLIAMRRRR